MKTASIKLGNARLLKLAAYIERRQRAQPKMGYDQRAYIHTCGAPACAIGHAEALFKRNDLQSRHFGAAFFGLDVLATGHWSDYMRLFATYGCDNARDDWRKAVRFIRDFVAARQEVRS